MNEDREYKQYKELVKESLRLVELRRNRSEDDAVGYAMFRDYVEGELKKLKKKGQ